MTQVVSSSDIEKFVGAKRHSYLHLGKWDTTVDRIFIMHSHECIQRRIDLRLCPFSSALDNGVEEESWEPDITVQLIIRDLTDPVLGSAGSLDRLEDRPKRVAEYFG